jgi:hypothetical protein
MTGHFLYMAGQSINKIKNRSILTLAFENSEQNV